VVGVRLDETQRLVQSAIDHARNIMAELRPDGLDDLGLFVPLKTHAELVAKRLGIPVNVTGGDPKPRLGSAVESAFYRIAQEALNNVAKYAHARNIGITLAAGGRGVTLSIADDGAGFDVSRVPDTSYGLRIMRERAEAVGARLAIDSAPGHGTRITVTV
jgi:signal transduction histidine kinase